MRRRGSAFGTVIALTAILVISWLALQKMTAAQRARLTPDAAIAAPPASPGAQVMPTIPAPILSAAAAAKTPVARLDVVVRVDGLDLTLDGAPVCRDGHRRLVGRAPGGEAGSFDETALVACMQGFRASDGQLVALITRAGASVPRTFVDALSAALRRGGAHDVVDATP